MSVTVDYLFNSDLDFGKLVTRINDSTGLGFVPYEGASSDQFCRFLGLELTLQADHGLEDDRECNFQDYEFIIQTRTPSPDADLRPMQIESMALIAFALFRRVNLTSGLLTFDVQVRLAQYQVADNQWIDQVSGNSVRFPDHFADLRSRILRDGWDA